MVHSVNSDCNIWEIRQIFKVPTTDEQNIQESENFPQALMLSHEGVKLEHIDELPKKKMTGGKGKKTLSTETKSS